jgi:hypothetical protein
VVQIRDNAEDMIRHIKPHERQSDFLEIPDDIYEALYGGAAYGGKSFILTLFPLIRGFYKYRGFKGIILRRKFPDLEREIIRVSQEYYPSTGAIYNEQKHSWRWPEYGSYMDFGHCQHANDIKQYDGYQVNYCAYDELTHFEEGMYQYMVGSRVRPGSAGINVAIVRNATNPGGIGQTFVYNRFVKPCEAGYKIIRDRKTNLDRIFIPALPQDNPYGMQYDPKYLDKLEILSEAEKRAKKYGDWHAFEGSVFPQFRPFRFPNEPDNALHVVPYFDIPSYWPRILSIDWGKRAMCHAMWAAMSPDNRLYIYREKKWLGVDVPFWAAEVKELSYNENIVDFVMCGSAWQSRGTETVAIQVERYSGMSPRSSENTAGSRVSGLSLVQDFLRWEQKPRHTISDTYSEELADKIFRIHGAGARESYIKQFASEEEEKNLPKLQILSLPGSDNPIAPVLCETIPIVTYDDTKIEDVAEFNGDDPIDNLRYLCRAATHYWDGSSEEMEKNRVIQNAVIQLQQTGDQTAFYRRMEKIESGDEDIFAVRRHSRFRRR